MKRLLISVLLAAALPAAAQDLLIRDATVHTAAAAGTLKDHDVLVQGGVVRAIGPDLAAPAGVPVVEAKGRPLTPGLFGGLTGLGIEEVSGEAATVDAGLALGAMVPAHEGSSWRPEFDVDVAFNPHSAAIGVNRVEGITFTVLAPSALPGGSFVAGQGSAVLLDGRYDAALPGSRSLFVNLGSDSSPLSGGSRAGQGTSSESSAEMPRSRASTGGSLEVSRALTKGVAKLLPMLSIGCWSRTPKLACAYCFAKPAIPASKSWLPKVEASYFISLISFISSSPRYLLKYGVP